MNFIESDICRDGVIAVVYGLKGTGKTTLMEQAMQEKIKDTPCLFLEAEKGDTMNTVRSYLDDAHDKKLRCVFIDNITEVSDFIDSSAILADYYAKCGIRIVISGDESFAFDLASWRQLFDRMIQVHTTYISFAEYCRIFGTKDIDNYLESGGLFELERNVCQYVGSSIAENIYYSIQKNSGSRGDRLREIPLGDLKILIQRMLFLYSKNLLVRKKQNQSSENQGFLEYINADIRLSSRICESAFKDLEDYLIVLDVLSATSVRRIEKHEDDNGFGEYSFAEENYLVQPFIKYSYMCHEKDEMTKQIVLHETDKSLPHSKKCFGFGEKGEKVFQVFKTEFYANGVNYGKFDMTIYQCHENCYWAFEIYHTTTPCLEQEKSLELEFLGLGYPNFANFGEVTDYFYGNRCEFAVLYCGESFQSNTGRYWLNIADFLLAVDKYKDMDKVMTKLTENLPKKDLFAEG